MSRRRTASANRCLIAFALAAIGDGVCPWAPANPACAQLANGAAQNAQDKAKTATDFNNGATFYSRGQYAAAADIFQKLLQANPESAPAALYLAHSYFALGKLTQARLYYDWLIKKFPNSSQAATAAMMEARIPASESGAKTNSPAKATDASGAGTQTGTHASADHSSHGAVTGEKFDMEKMIRVVRPAMNHPACTPEFIQLIKDSLDKCPEPVLEYCAKNGCKICITPTLVDRNPELRNRKPRGYQEGYTYKNTPAMFDRPEVVVCQYAQVGENEDNLQPNDDAVGALRHEFGHAVDHFLHYVSNTEEFKHIYYIERAKITDKDALAYYIQEGTEHGGASETFAQACCIIFGGDTSSFRVKQDAMFKQAFTGLIDYVKKKLNSI